MDVRILEDAGALQSAAADLVAEYLRAGGTDVALAGGSTPRPVHRRLAALDLPWSDVTLWLGDERWVPPDHEDANARMARSTLADEVTARFVAPDTTGSDPAIAAAHYEITLRTVLDTDENGRVSPGLVMLGMGADGHTASLFPGTDSLDRTDRDYVATWVAAKDAWRLTVTLPVLWRADQIVFMVTGSDKAATVSEIIDEAVPYPAQQVAAGAPEVTWLLDRGAASGLRNA